MSILRLLIDRLSHWLTYRPERRYMRGGGGGGEGLTAVEARRG